MNMRVGPHQGITRPTVGSEGIFDRAAYADKTLGHTCLPRGASRTALLFYARVSELVFSDASHRKSTRRSRIADRPPTHRAERDVSCSRAAVDSNEKKFVESRFSTTAATVRKRLVPARLFDWGLVFFFFFFLSSPSHLPGGKRKRIFLLLYLQPWFDETPNQEYSSGGFAKFISILMKFLIPLLCRSIANEFN